MENVQAVSELALTLGQGAVYEMLSPLERLYEHPAAEVRAAVLRGAAKSLTPAALASFARGWPIRRRRSSTRRCACCAQMHFVDGARAALTRIFRESTDERVRLAALEGIGRASTSKPPRRRWCSSRPSVRRPGPSARRPRRGWRGVRGGDEMVTLIRQARDAEIGDRREILDRVLRSVHVDRCAPRSRRARLTAAAASTRRRAGRSG